MRSRHHKLLIGIGLSIAPVVTTLALLGAGPAQPKDVVVAVTDPLTIRSLTFNFPGVIRSVAVEEGQAVTIDQPLMVQDTDIEDAELKRLNNEANSEDRIRYYLAGLEFKEQTYKRKFEANAKNPDRPPYNEYEIGEAKADRDQAREQINVAKLDHMGDQIKRDQQQLKVNKMTLRSPCNGIVKEIRMHGGELSVLDRDKPTMILVENDPCLVRIEKLTSAQVALLKQDDVLEVQYTGENQWRQAKIVYISPVADMSGMRHVVKAQLPNPEKRATGVEIMVKLPAKLLEPTVVGQR